MHQVELQQTFVVVFFYFLEKASHFQQIFCLAESSNKMLSFIVSEK